MAITARKFLHGGAAGTIAQGVADVGGISFGLWEMVTGFFADILAGLFAVLAGAAQLLVLPLQVLWQSLVTVVTGAAGAIASGLNGLWQHVTGFFAYIVAGIAGAAHLLVLPLEKLWQWLATSMADAVGAIISALDGPWQLVVGFLPGAWATLVNAAHEIPRKLAELCRWIQAAAPVLLPYVLGIAAVVLVAALVWFFCCPAPALLAASVGVGQVLVIAAFHLGHGLSYVCSAVCSAFASLLPSCMQCLNCAAGVTMNAPGASGMLISRPAFEAAPALFFALMRAAPPIVAATVFCSESVASVIASPVAALFGVRR
jgi:hypothetical protein